jgi:hypothetical protein
VLHGNPMLVVGTRERRVHRHDVADDEHRVAV